MIGSVITGIDTKVTNYGINNALFEVYNSLGDIIGSYKSDNKGNISIELEYGNYDIIQMEGKEGYEMVPSIHVDIKDTSSIFYYELFDNEIIKEDIVLNKVIEEDEVIEEEKEIEEEVEEVGNVEIEEDVIIEEIPPNTYVKLPVKNIIKYVVDYLKKFNRYAILL